MSIVKRSGRGFTLVELLVVISIIMLLASILMPALGATLWQARIAGCQQNMHTVGVAIGQYASSYMMDHPWVYYDGTGDGPQESELGAGVGSWNATTPGNPALALYNSSPAYERFLDTAEAFFCPISEWNYEENYHENAIANGFFSRWGSYRYVWPHVPGDEDPFYSDSPRGSSRMAHVNSKEWVGANSKDLVMHDSIQDPSFAYCWETWSYPHMNALVRNGAVSFITTDIQAMADYLYGVDNDWYFH
jgi:prepilin-type N-terminal cleavage/methylation domain-containing protein